MDSFRERHPRIDTLRTMDPLEILANPNCSDCLVPTRESPGRDWVECPECGERQQWDPQQVTRVCVTRD